MNRHYGSELGNVNESVDKMADLASSEDRSIYGISEVISNAGLGCEPGFYETFVAKKQSDAEYWDSDDFEIDLKSYEQSVSS